ncbi:thymus-specific serine protease-like [Sceloporus undulatus]|uniref:thymus-specific serine protease-like n=1 Tax=Sceloporus undulatus TaxID=8520 RepID=UPI001C4B99D8|nr:thymus-specific serine protease-like [Sceloporus undulatus]XP_042299611.1 thymus-specific serine protease-like [Sceloporus undulatus]
MAFSGRLFGGLSLLLVMLSLAQAVRQFHVLRQRLLQQQEEHNWEKFNSRKLKPGMAQPELDSIMGGNIRQPLDHFNKQNRITFNQRYYINSDFFRPGNPVFLYIGGEGELSGFVAIMGHHVNLAEQYGALLVALEHRFYGSSLNPDMLEDRNLPYLNSQQALSDLVSFQQFITQKYKLTQNNTWICFGGSYPGSLAAWFRLKFPHLVFGAIASSAPVRAQVDFSGYEKVVAESLSNPVIGGSKQCLDAVAEGFAAVEKLVLAGQLQKLEKDFQSCTHVQGHSDSIELLSNMADVLMFIVQYNNEGENMANVNSLCKTMTDPNIGSAYERLTVANLKALKSIGLPCVHSSHTEFIQLLRDTKVTKDSFMRPWIFQTCTEFGYFMTCEDPICPFSKLVDLKFQMDVCKEAFNISSRSAQDAVSFTNEYYGADHPKATRVLFVNGDVDPWHSLSVLEDQSSSERAILINGTAHCADMNMPSNTDPLPLVEARKKINAQVGEWLKLAKEMQQDS